MKRLLYCAGALLVAACATNTAKTEADVPTLKDHFADDFLVGVAVNQNQVNGLDPKADSITRLHFNSIVAENCMKSEVIHPEEGRWDWAAADSFVDYGVSNGMKVIGHTLIWHSQLAPWFAVDSAGNPVTPEVLKARMKEHITTIMQRYKGRILGYDVVNEAILDDGTYRPSPFYQILGEEYIPLAFQYAMEADSTAELYINDYSMASPAKREVYVRIVNDLCRRGLRVDAVGIQAHMGMDYPDFAELEKSIEAYAATGAKVMFTEMDMSALPTVSSSANISDRVAYEKAMNPYPDGLPDSVAAVWNARMDTVMSMLLRHRDVVTRVNWWGTHDGMSWKNDFPVKGRTEYPLAFDRDYNLKPFLKDKL